MALVSHLVRHVHVDLVSDSGEHRQRRVGDGHRDEFGVEGGQIGLATATADDDDHVDVVPSPERADGRRHLGGGGVALHGDVGDLDVEAETGLLDLLQEIGDSRGSLAAHDAESQRHRVQFDLAVAPVGTGLFQSSNQFLALERDVAQGVVGVDTPHDERELAEAAVVVEVSEDADLETVGQVEPALHERGSQLLHLRAPQVHAHLHLATSTVDVDQVEVRVGVLEVQARHLAPHPQTLVEVIGQHLVDLVGQLGDGEGAHPTGTVDVLVGEHVVEIVEFVDVVVAHGPSILPQRRQRRAPRRHTKLCA
ncbi:unannotated protein [freshwater metagenome]|uniref:Unannotated protein n=1 Tax=freshwater metagenome TaxID=449393 RepID=A0A6J6G635_9ZZZZ